MAKAHLKQRTVELEDPDGPWTRVVLEAAETLAGNPIEVRDVEGRRYFVAPSSELARLCRRWLMSPLPDASGAAQPGLYARGYPPGGSWHRLRSRGLLSGVNAADRIFVGDEVG